MKKYIHIVLMLLVFSSCSDYLEQDAGELNTIDKIFASEVETKKWYSRMYSDDFMVQEMHYSGQIPYFGVLTRLLMLWKVIFVIFLKA